MCILDELGRGTATFDGTAIAHAVIDHLVNKTHSLSLFATHYHFLVEDWDMDPRVSLGFMDCIVQADDSSRKSEEVTFLYKLCTGTSPRSYGINVARLARLPEIVIQIAMEQSFDFEGKMKAVGEINEKFRNRIQSYFDKLVSIIQDSMSEDELYYYSRELWQRYTAEMNLK